MNNRIKQIKEKGFNMAQPNLIDTDVFSPVDFSKIKVGLQTLDDAVFDLGDLRKANPRLTDKKAILMAIEKQDIDFMREVSVYFMRSSGIYSRLIKYLSYLYRYDWLLTPYINEEKETTTNKALNDFHKVLTLLDNFNIKRYCGETALKIFINGCYYGYIIDNDDSPMIQELPIKYCRSRFKVGNKPVVEFNMKYFDDAFKDINQRLRILNLFPNEFKKGYKLFKEGKLIPDFQGDTSGWYLLDTDKAFKFNINGEDFPVFISVIPHILDLDAAQELDRKKTLQQLLKIIIQKMPLDKNGDLVFDVDEAKELHNNAVRMLGKAIGVDVLTTFADVEVADMADKSTVTSIDALDKVERTVYNESGTAQNLFNASGNLALTNSILNDEASIFNLILQFTDFLNVLIEPFNKNKKKYYFKIEMLTTTIYNYKELSKSYKELTTLGYSKLLPLVALGHSQSSILATLHFENKVLDFTELLIPPRSSNTMSADALEKIGEKDSDKGGRKEKPDEEKSDKTIANRESMN